MILGLLFDFGMPNNIYNEQMKQMGICVTCANLDNCFLTSQKEKVFSCSEYDDSVNMYKHDRNIEDQITVEKIPKQPNSNEVLKLEVAE
ncbi:MAG: hypothetical protein CMP59_11880 [Flavobacteriales bacterium]|nr:hypothetical protein [Flavobacteriales bacterium]